MEEDILWDFLQKSGFLRSSIEEEDAILGLMWIFLRLYVEYGPKGLLWFEVFYGRGKFEVIYKKEPLMSSSQDDLLRP